MNKTIKISLYPFLGVLLYLFCVIRFAYIPNINAISLSAGILIFLYLILKGAVFGNKKYIKINIALYLFCFSAIVSSLINFKNFDGTILYCLKIIDILLFTEFVCELKCEKKMAIIYFAVSTLLSIITIVYANIHPLAAWYNELNYLIGSKFLVSYNALASILFFAYGFDSIKKNGFIYKIIVLALFIFNFYVCFRVKCSTGMIGIFFLFFLLMSKSQKKLKITSFLTKSWTAVLIILFSATVVLLFSNFIVNIPLIKYVIEDVFNKNSDLSGRLIVYKNIFNYFKGHWLLGYGFNNVYSVFKNTMKIRTNSYAYDAQNALLEYMLYFGIIGCAFFLNFIKKSFSNISRSNHEVARKKFYFIVGFYMMIFLGTVEITFNPLFYLFLSYISCDKQEICEVCEEEKR